MAKKTIRKRDPCRMYAPSHGVDLYRCKKCHHVTDEQNYDDIGATKGRWFCTQCHHEQHPIHVGWERKSFRT